MFAAAVWVLAAFVSYARADAATLIRLHANSVRFYYDRFLLEADGNVAVTTGDGMRMQGDALSMDLRLNRFVLAGHVHVADPAGSQDGAALADFLDFNRMYFIPVTAEPDRWTFINGDFAHPAKGRIMPGDTFFLPDLTGTRAYLTASEVTIEPRNFLRFGPSRVDAAGVGAYIPLPSYYVNFSTNRYLAENSLSGATADATYQAAGNANYITALHARYDPSNGIYGSFEQHVVSPKAYAVFSLNPATRPAKFWNLVGEDQPANWLDVREFTQLYTYQNGLSEPSASAQHTYAEVNAALPNSTLQLTTMFDNQSLLGPVGHNPDHQLFLTLGVLSNVLDQYKAVRFTYRYGFGLVDDGYRPLQVLRGAPYSEEYLHYFGLNAYTPSLDVTHFNAAYAVPDKDVFFNAVIDKQRTWYSSPHFIDTTTTTASLSRIMDGVAQHVSSYAAYSVENVGDYYGAQQRLAYPVIVKANHVLDPGYAAFDGFATFRTLSLGTVYNNRGNFSASLVFRRHDDFPKPVPGFFTLPPTDVFGRYVYSPYFGQPPYDLTPDVRIRVSAHLALDLSRTYYFHFGGLNWSQYYTLQVTQ